MSIGRVYKAQYRGLTGFFYAWGSNEEEFEKNSKIAEATPQFKRWWTPTMNITQTDISLHVEQLNVAEQKREKHTGDHLAVALYHVGRALNTAEASLKTMRISFDDLHALVERREEDLSHAKVEINNLRMELGMPPVEGWDEWAKHQVPVDPETERKIEEALFGPGGREAWKARNGR